MAEDIAIPQDIFEEPPGYREKPKPFTYQSYNLENGQKLNLRLVGFDPLWGHRLFHSALVLARYLQHNTERLVSGRTVLELGAGCGLPGLLCAVKGASRVVLTDYPSGELIENLSWNVQENLTLNEVRESVDVKGYVWGSDITGLQKALSGANGDMDPVQTRFDVVILSDLLFNHSCHRDLTRTLIKTLRGSGNARALVFFTPHRPWLLQRDLVFFEIIKGVRRSRPDEPCPDYDGIFLVPTIQADSQTTSLGRSAQTLNGDTEKVELSKDEVKDAMANVPGKGEVFVVEKAGIWEMDNVMFEDDEGDDVLRRTVFGWEISWNLDWQSDVWGR